MELQTLGADQLERVSRFIEPLFMETYGDKVTNGPEAARAIFDRWDTVEPLKRKHASGVRYFMHAEGGKDLGLIALKKEENGAKRKKLLFKFIILVYSKLNSIPGQLFIHIPNTDIKFHILNVFFLFE